MAKPPSFSDLRSLACASPSRHPIPAAIGALVSESVAVVDVLLQRLPSSESSHAPRPAPRPQAQAWAYRRVWLRINLGSCALSGPRFHSRRQLRGHEDSVGRPRSQVMTWI